MLLQGLSVNFTINIKLTYYIQILEIENTNCDFKELKKCYYKMVFQYHPDNKETNEEKELSNQQMMVINGAYRLIQLLQYII